MIVPYPDLYIQMTSPLTTEGGNVFDYTLTYGNASRMCAEKPSIVLTLPPQNVEPPLKAVETTATLKAMTVNASEKVYAYPCPYLAQAPVFNRDDPLTGGWMTGTVKNACYLAVQVPESNFCASQGTRTLVLTMQATYPTN